MPRGLQFLGRIADPEGERGTVDGDTVRRQHLRLAVKRQMPMILGIDHMRDEPLGRQSSPDQSLGSSMLEDDAVTGAAGEFGAAGDDNAILRRYDVQPLALIVTDLKKVACAARAAGWSGHQGLDDARQMLRQLATIGPALGSSLLACFGIGAVLGCFESRDSLINILQNKLELISVKLFRRSTELRVFCKLEQPLEPGAAIQQSRGKGTQLGWIARQFIRQITHWPESAMLRATMQRRFNSLRKCFRLRDSRRMHGCPIHAGQKRGQLRGVHSHDAVNDRRPLEGAALKPLPIQHEATTIPDNNLHPISALRTEDHRHALHRVMAQRLLRQEHQTIRTLSEVHRLRRHVNHEARGWRQHERVRRSAKNTSLNTARPGVPRTSTLAPRNSTVTVDVSGDTEASAVAGSANSDTKGTNDKVSAEAGSTNWPNRARRRQSCTSLGRQPWRRATSVTIAPGSRLSAAICAFKSSGQRFRPAPAYTSIRGGNGRLMSSEWSSIMSTLAEDDSSSGALRIEYNNSQGPQRHAYDQAADRASHARFRGGHR